MATNSFGVVTQIGDGVQADEWVQCKADGDTINTQYIRKNTDTSKKLDEALYGVNKHCSGTLAMPLPRAACGH